jgi:predicted helicase
MHGPVVNPSLTLTGIPPEAYSYRVIDQYRVTEDARSGIRSDPTAPTTPNTSSASSDI